jgi:hypothetical protein
MPSTFTGNTGIELIADGEQSGLWGQTTNGNLTIVDRALNGSVNISLSGTTHTLTTADGVLSDGQFAVLVFTGSPSGTNTVSIEPNTAQKTYFVTNSTAQTVVLSQGSGATVSVPVGRSRIVFTNGAGAGAAVFDITNTLSGTMSQQNATAVNIDGGTIDGTTIGGASAAAGTFTTATATTGNITTVNATTVDTTNIEVTNIKAKDGTASATIADSTGVLTVASSVLTTTDINGGTIDGTTIGGTTAAAGTFTSVSASGNITVSGTVDGRDVATDGSKLDGIEAGADVTDTDNVTAAGALMDSELTDIAAVKALNQGVATTDSPSFAGLTATTVDTTNIEVTNIKAKDGTASATIADSTGVLTVASSVLTTTDINGGTIDGTTIGGTTAAAGTFTSVSASGNITVSGTVDGRDVATDGSKLDGIEAGADVTDTDNVTAAGALMDSELTDIAAVKALNQGVATTDSPSFAGLTATTADINGGTIDGTTIGGTTAAAGTFTSVSASGNITVGGTVDGRDVATDGSKLDGIEAGADVTDTDNVTAAGALMDSELTDIAAVKALNQGVATTDSPSFAGLTATTADINGGTIDGTTIGGTTAAAGTFTSVSASGNITVGGTVDGRDVATDGSKLDGIEAGADVTDTDNVTAAGALMDSELTDIAAVKALNQGVATTDSPSFAGLTATTADINGGTIDGTTIGGTTAAAGTFTSVSASGNITVGGTVDGRDVATDGSKLDGIEAGADVTDTDNVTAAGALMDSELTDIAAVKALNQGVATTDSPSFAGLTATTADINGGTIDGTVIGGSTPAAISGTTGSFLWQPHRGHQHVLFVDAANQSALGLGQPALLQLFTQTPALQTLLVCSKAQTRGPQLP